MNKYKTLSINIPIKEIGYLESNFTTYNNINENHPVVLLLPPNPKFGATMNNRVIKILSDIFLDFNFNVLKVNYRGVGKSQGVSQGNDTEIIDILNVLDWLIKKNEIMNKVKTPNIWIVGYGFGAYISLQIAMRRPEITGFIAIAAPFQSIQSQFNMLTPFPSGLIIHATNDKTCKTSLAENFYKQLIVQKDCDVELCLQDNNHYFENEELLKESIIDYVSNFYIYNKKS